MLSKEKDDQARKPLLVGRKVKTSWQLFEKRDLSMWNWNRI